MQQLAVERHAGKGRRWVLHATASVTFPSTCVTLYSPAQRLSRARDHLISMRFLRHMWRFLVAVQLLPALENGEETTLVGGQAVLEGVMMRSPHAWAISVRKPSGEVATHSEPLERPSEKHKWMGWPVIRGVATLGQAMALGVRALKFSANTALDDPNQKPEDKIQIS